MLPRSPRSLIGSKNSTLSVGASLKDAKQSTSAEDESDESALRKKIDECEATITRAMNRIIDFYTRFEKNDLTLNLLLGLQTDPTRPLTSTNQHEGFRNVQVNAAVFDWACNHQEKNPYLKTLIEQIDMENSKRKQLISELKNIYTKEIKTLNEQQDADLKKPLASGSVPLTPTQIEDIKLIDIEIKKVILNIKPVMANVFSNVYGQLLPTCSDEELVKKAETFVSAYPNRVIKLEHLLEQLNTLKKQKENIIACRPCLDTNALKQRKSTLETQIRALGFRVAEEKLDKKASNDSNIQPVKTDAKAQPDEEPEQEHLCCALEAFENCLINIMKAINFHPQRNLRGFLRRHEIDQTYIQLITQRDQLVAAINALQKKIEPEKEPEIQKKRTSASPLKI